MSDSPSFLRALFDVRFRSFVTGRLVPVLYVLTIVGLLFLYLVIAVAILKGGGEAAVINSSGELETSGGGGSTAFGLLWLFILGPLMLILYTLFYRVVFELLIIIFRIWENTQVLAAAHRPAAGGQSPSGPPA